LERHPLSRLPLILLAIALIVSVGGCRRSQATEDDGSDVGSAAPAQAAKEQRPPAQLPETQPATAPAQPEPAVSKADLARQALADGDNDRAVALLQSALAEDADNDELTRQLGAALIASKRFDEAADLCQRLADGAPKDVTARYNLAVIRMRLGQFHMAEPELRRVLAEDPNHAEARYNLAVALQAQDKLTEARNAWQAVLAGDNPPAGAHMHLGAVLMELQQAEEAYEQFRQAVALMDDDADAWVNLASAARATGRYGYATVALKRATALQPEDARTWADLGRTLLTIYRTCTSADLEMLSEAVVAMHRSLALDPDQPELRQALREYEPLLQEARARQMDVRPPSRPRSER